MHKEISCFKDSRFFLNFAMSLAICVVMFLNISHYFSVDIYGEDTKYKVFGVNPFYISYFLYAIVIALFFKVNKAVILYMMFSLCYVTLYMVSSIYSGVSSYDINTAISLALLLLFSCSIVLYYNYNIDKILKVFIVYSLISSIFSLLLAGGATIGGFSQPINYKRLVGWYGNPNFLATDIGIAVIVSFFYSYCIKRGIYIVLLFFYLSVLFLTGSKSILGFLLIILVLYSSFRFFDLISKRSIRGNTIVLLMLSLLFFVLIVTFLILSEHTLVSDLKDINKLTSATGRVDIWLNYLQIYRDSSFFEWLFGLGRNYLTDKTLLGRSAHSFYIRALLEHGLLFLLFMFLWFFYLLFCALSLIKKNKSYTSWAILCILIYLILRNITTPELLKLHNPSNIILYCLSMYLLNFRIKNNKG